MKTIGRQPTHGRSYGIPTRRCVATMRCGWARATAVAVLLTGGQLAGCGPSEREINEFVHDFETSVAAVDYRVQPPDTLVINSPTSPEIDGEAQTVRLDGKINLRLLGEVKVAGMSPVEISRKLESLLAEYYVTPTVSVTVADGGTKRYYVFGEVERSGPFKFTGRNSLLNALAEAKPTFLAWRSQVRVIHPSHKGADRHVMVVDAEKMIQDGDLTKNVLLQEGDIVFIPPTPLAWLGYRVQEVLLPLSPVQQAVTQPLLTKAVLENELAED